jgi:hypothetical protein
MACFGVTTEAGEYPQKTKITGVQEPPGPVSVYVRSRDGRWYAQKKVVVSGVCWTADVTLGSDTTPDGTEFLIACRGGTGLAAVLEDLPDVESWIYREFVLQR